MKRGRPRIGTELKKATDYKYDYPENRELGKQLLFGDFVAIARFTGYSVSYVHNILVYGNRHNEKVVKVTRMLVKSREKLMKEVCQ